MAEEVMVANEIVFPGLDGGFATTGVGAGMGVGVGIGVVHDDDITTVGAAQA
jgi:hypothetical protein